MTKEDSSTPESKPSTEPNKNPSNDEPQKQESWGYDLYPERRGTFKPKLSKVLTGSEGTENFDKIKCEKNVYECVKTSKSSHP